MGEPFHHFYCPVLFLDDEAELCKAHIVNAVFAGSTRWTVQRKDVDNFYGHVFESDADTETAITETAIAEQTDPTVQEADDESRDEADRHG